jgi:hypothetical protein
MMAAVIFVAALLGAFEAGRRWERQHVRRGALKVQKLRHAGTWELKNAASSREPGPTSNHQLE